MKTGDKMADKAIRKLLAEGFREAGGHPGHPRSPSLLLTNYKTHESAVIKWGERKEATLERGPTAASSPAIKMPVSAYLAHWKP